MMNINIFMRKCAHFYDESNFYFEYPGVNAQAKKARTLMRPSGGFLFLD